MKAESKVVDQLRMIARKRDRFPVQWVVMYSVPLKGQAFTNHFQVLRGADILSELFDRSIKGWYITHARTDRFSGFHDLILKLHESETMDTNIGPETMNALAHVIDPKMKGGF